MLVVVLSMALALVFLDFVPSGGLAGVGLSCDSVCFDGGYSRGFCLPESAGCVIDGSVHEGVGDVFCSERLSVDSFCCCLGISQDTDGDRNVLTKSVGVEFVYAVGQRVAKVEGEDVFFFVNDHLGSPRRVLDVGGAVVSELDFLPFGGEMTASGEDFKYTGKELDFDSGLHYYGARFYDSVLGRFVTPDIVEKFPNPYVYVANNPMRNIDPTGEQVVNLAGRQKQLAAVTSWTKKHMPEPVYNVLNFVLGFDESMETRMKNSLTDMLLPMSSVEKVAKKGGSKILDKVGSWFRKKFRSAPVKQYGPHSNREFGRIYNQLREWGADWEADDFLKLHQADQVQYGDLGFNVFVSKNPTGGYWKSSDIFTDRLGGRINLGPELGVTIMDMPRVPYFWGFGRKRMKDATAFEASVVMHELQHKMNPGMSEKGVVWQTIRRKLGLDVDYMRPSEDFVLINNRLSDNYLDMAKNGIK